MASTSFEQRETRISKENLYMVLALWMEEFESEPLDIAESRNANDSAVKPKSKESASKSKPNSNNSSSLATLDQSSSQVSPSTSSSPSSKEIKKVGVVFVLPNDRVLSVDCTRDGVHGVARVIIKHCSKLEGCKVFISRKPCSMCAKLLVQARVLRVFYLPIEPESQDPEELQRVDNLFKVSSVAQSVFVPCVEKKVLTKENRKRPQHVTPNNVTSCKKKLVEKWWNEEWMEQAQDKLPWPAFDKKMKDQVETDFKSFLKWIAEIKTPLDKADMKFYKVNVEDSVKDLKLDRTWEAIDFPEDVAKHMIIFAKMLARQTDDPKTGVGAVLMKRKENEILSVGWNGFPSKALYGELPRASDDDDTNEKKYPYVIHAEQNALMLRNEKDLTDGILFVTKCPCNECIPLVKLSGVKTVVVGEELGKSTGGKLSYNKIKEYIRDCPGFKCYEMRASRSPEKPHSARELRYDKKGKK